MVSLENTVPAELSFLVLPEGLYGRTKSDTLMEEDMMRLWRSTDFRKLDNLDQPKVSIRMLEVQKKYLQELQQLYGMNPSELIRFILAVTLFEDHRLYLKGYEQPGSILWKQELRKM